MKGCKSTRRVVFEGIAGHRNVNIMLYEPKKNARSVWQLVFGNILHKNVLLTINMGLLKGHCSYNKKINLSIY